METYTKKEFQWNYSTYFVVSLEDGKIAEFELLEDALNYMDKLVSHIAHKHYFIQKIHTIATIIK